MRKALSIISGNGVDSDEGARRRKLPSLAWWHCTRFRFEVESDWNALKDRPISCQVSRNLQLTSPKKASIKFFFALLVGGVSEFVACAFVLCTDSNFERSTFFNVVQDISQCRTRHFSMYTTGIGKKANVS